MSGGVNWSEADLRAHEQRGLGDAGGGVQTVAPRSLPKEQQYRSKTEIAFAQWLSLQQAAGEIGGWQYEAARLRLAPGNTYVPDFIVLDKGGAFLHFAEVKGRKGNTFYSRPVGKLKIVMAARLFPWWRFCIYWPGERGEWERWEL